MRRFAMLLSLITFASASKCKEETYLSSRIKNKLTMNVWNPECNCDANDYTGVGELGEAERVPCRWNEYYPIYGNKSDNTRIMPCTGYGESHYSMQGVDGPCVFIKGAQSKNYEDIDYPPRAKHRGGWADQTPGYCQLKKDGKLVSQEDFYKVLFTCWVFDCESRLRKPKQTLSKKWKKLKGNNWCWPPTIHLDFYDEFSNFKSDNREICSTKYMNDDVDNGVIFPPFCDEKVFRENGIKVIDSEFFMYPLSRDPAAKARGEVDKSFCEVLCPAQNNTGYWRDEPCRYIPSCGQEDIFEVGKCLPWCSFNVTTPSPDDYKRWGRKDNCNNRPVCTITGRKLAARFTEENPFDSDYCIPARCCGAEETPDTHFCTAGVTAEPVIVINATVPDVVHTMNSTNGTSTILARIYANGSGTISEKIVGLIFIALLLAAM